MQLKLQYTTVMTLLVHGKCAREMHSKQSKEVLQVRLHNYDHSIQIWQFCVYSFCLPGYLWEC